MSNFSFGIQPNINKPRSVFNRSTTRKFTMDSGLLIPFFCDEVLPGDTINLDASFFGRLSTPVAPIMDNIYLDVHYFFVPNRLVWKNWERFMGQRDNPSDSIDYLVPQVTGNVNLHSVGDYFGLPINKNLSVNALPFRAYQKIYNDHYRDQNLIDSVVINDGDNATDVSSFSLFKRGKRPDYFTTCLPWPQKGESVTLGLTGSANVTAPNGEFVIGQPRMQHPTGVSSIWAGVNGDDNHGWLNLLTPTTGSITKLLGTLQSKFQVDLESVTAVNINSLRQAMQLQVFLEREARGGSRYVELLNVMYGVDAGDYRLQRSEYLGGSSVMVNMYQVPQTSSSDSATPQGNLAAFGTVASSGRGFSKAFVEHGFVIGICSARADYTYQFGINRNFSRKSRYDYAFPVFAHLGEQAVLNSEIFYAGDDKDDDVFGYQERYAEYRTNPSVLSGLFRSDAPLSLDFWHLAQDFKDRPLLNKDFIEENPPVKRALAVQDQPDFIVDARLSIKHARVLPVYGTPSFGERI